MNSACISPFGPLMDLAEWIWKDWPHDMNANTLSFNTSQFSLSGTCPHCSKGTVFIMSSSPVETMNGGTAECRSVMRCQGCQKYILGCVSKMHSIQEFQYREHYPLGKPDDNVAAEIPANIAADFRESLRCRFVDAYNATVEMCRRAIQAACIQQGAPDGNLAGQIDWLASEGIVTKPLKEMAHRVRLGGNLGAHPPERCDDQTAITINAEYADAVLAFAREFFHHVYVMPEQLKKYTFKKSGM